MRKVLSFAIAVLFVFQCFALCANANPYVSYLGNELEAFPQCSDEIVSSDGKYGYVFNEETGDCYFSHSFEKNITVLNIPEEIDGHRIVGVIDGKAESRYTLAEVNYSKYIKDIYRGGMTFSLLPSCRINLNEGLETIHRDAYHIQEYGFDEYYCNYNYYYESLDQLVFPSTLKEIKAHAIYPNVRRLVFQSDPVIDMTCNETDLELPLWSGVVPSYQKEIYFTGDAENADVNSFAVMFNGYSDGYYNGGLANYFFKIYHKPGAKGFEKFEEDSRLEVKEYTHEFWKDNVSCVQVTSINADNTVISLSFPDEGEGEKILDKRNYLEATASPENATDQRVWFFLLEPQKVLLRMDGRVGAYESDYDILDGKTVTVRAVASNGVYTDFEIQFVKDEPTVKSQPATDGNTLTAGSAIEKIRAFFSDIFNAVLNFFSNVIKTVKGFFVK